MRARMRRVSAVGRDLFRRLIFESLIHGRLKRRRLLVAQRIPDAGAARVEVALQPLHELPGQARDLLVSRARLQ